MQRYFLYILKLIPVSCEPFILALCFIALDIVVFYIQDFYLSLSQLSETFLSIQNIFIHFSMVKFLCISLLQSTHKNDQKVFPSEPQNMKMFTVV